MRMRVALIAVGLSFAALVSLAALGGARAADVRAQPAPVQPAPSYNWNGFYFGGFAGGVWGNTGWVDPTTGAAASPSTDGVIAGGQIGFNQQWNDIVLGLEADWGWTGAKGSTACPGGGSGCALDLNWIATVSGRLGYAVTDRALVYAKGGAAWVGEEATLAPGTALTRTRGGWLVGAGLEYAFRPNWSAKFEYNYLDLGTDRLAAGGQLADIDQQLHVIKLGVNYRFGW